MALQFSTSIHSDLRQGFQEEFRLGLCMESRAGVNLTLLLPVVSAAGKLDSAQHMRARLCTWACLVKRLAVEAAVQSTPCWNILTWSPAVRMSHISGTDGGISLRAAVCLRRVSNPRRKERGGGDSFSSFTHQREKNDHKVSAT